MNLEKPQRYCPITGFPLNLKPWPNPFSKLKRGGVRTNADKKKTKEQKISRRKNR